MANIYLHWGLDGLMGTEDGGIAWSRYSDDIAILTSGRGSALQARMVVDDLLRKCALTLSDKKTALSAARHRVTLPKPVLGISLAWRWSGDAWTLEEPTG